MKKKLILGAMIVLLFSVYTAVRWDEAQKTVVEESPEFSLEIIRGDKAVLSKANLGGKPVILNFWATWCTACKGETPFLKALSQDLKTASIVGVASYDEEKRVRASKKLKDLDIDMALDSDGSVASAFGIHALPQTVVLGAKGEILMRVRGRLKEQHMTKLREMF